MSLSSNGVFINWTQGPNPVNKYVLTDTPGFSFAGFVYVTAFTGFQTILTKGNSAQSLRPFFMCVCGNAGFGTLNSLEFFPDNAGNFGIYTTNAISLNHWYFWCITHSGTTYNLYCYDLTSPAGLMATSNHGTPGNIQADSNALDWVMGRTNNNVNGFNGAWHSICGWQGVLTAAEAQMMAYGVVPIYKVRPASQLWNFHMDLVGGQCTPMSGNFLGQGEFQTGINFYPLVPPSVGYPYVKNDLTVLPRAIAIQPAGLMGQILT